MTDQQETKEKPILDIICLAFAGESNSLVVGNRWLNFRGLNVITLIDQNIDPEIKEGEEYFILSVQGVPEQIRLTPEESKDFYEKMKGAAQIIKNQYQKINSPILTAGQSGPQSRH